MLPYLFSNTVFPDYFGDWKVPKTRRQECLRYPLNTYDAVRTRSPGGYATTPKCELLPIANWQLNSR